MATAVAPEPAGPGPAVASRPLSAEIAALEARLADGSVPLHAVLDTLRGRAYELLMVLLALPFTVSASVPGMSTPLGLAIVAIAAPLAVGRLPWLPRRLLEAKLPAGFFRKVFAAARGIVRFLEKFLRVRLTALTETRRLVALHLLAIVVAALLLALPLPIPLTNLIPAWAILLIALGLMERDGLFIAAGHFVLWLSIAYFLLLGDAVQHSLHWMLDWLGR